MVFGVFTLLLIIPIFSNYPFKTNNELISFYGMYLFTAVSFSFVGGAIYDALQYYKRKTSNKALEQRREKASRPLA